MSQLKPGVWPLFRPENSFVCKHQDVQRLYFLQLYNNYISMWPILWILRLYFLHFLVNFFPGSFTSGWLARVSAFPPTHFKAPQDWALPCFTAFLQRLPCPRDPTRVSLPQVVWPQLSHRPNKPAKEGKNWNWCYSLELLLLFSLTFCCQSDLSPASGSFIDFHFSTTEKDGVAVLPGPLSVLRSDIQTCPHVHSQERSSEQFQALFQMFSLTWLLLFLHSFCSHFKLQLTYNIVFVSDVQQWWDIYITSEMISPISPGPTIHS